MIKLVNLRGVTGQSRIESYQGREHLVVPVVALMEGVIWPVNAQGAEFVSADVLATATQAWNGHPVVMGHPMVDGQPVSANSPRVLEAHGFGTIFNTAVSERVLETKKLEVEAWLDIESATRVGSSAERVVQRVKDGEQVEVSVGAMVALEERAGTHNGKAFRAVWTKITPDHLAMLGENEQGACSVAMGCGTNRVAAMHVLTESGLEPENVPEEEPMKRTLLQRLRSAFALETAEGQSDVDLRRALDAAIRATEPGYWGIEEVFPADKTVIYAAMPEEKILTVRRSYTVAEDGAVTLSDDRIEVEPVTEWKPVNAAEGGTPPPLAEPSTRAAASCGCGGHSNPEPTGGSTDMDKTQRIAALITNEKSPFKSGDEAFLQTCSDERLTEFETLYKAEAEAAPTAAASGEPAETPEQAEARWLAGAPQSVRDAVARDKARVAAEKTALVTVLKGCTNGAYTEQELNAMDLPGLQKMAKAHNVTTQPQAVDYSLQGAPRAAGGREQAPPPIDMNEKIRAARAAGK